MKVVSKTKIIYWRATPTTTTMIVVIIKSTKTTIIILWLWLWLMMMMMVSSWFLDGATPLNWEDETLTFSHPVFEIFLMSVHSEHRWQPTLFSLFLKTFSKVTFKGVVVQDFSIENRRSFLEETGEQCSVRDFRSEISLHNFPLRRITFIVL